MRGAENRKPDNFYNYKILAAVIVALGWSASPVLTASAQAQASQCKGPRVMTVRPKIVGGWRARIKDWPGQVSVRLHNPQTQQSFHFCGASAISPNWLLTAAHCFFGLVDESRSGGYAVSFGEIEQTQKLGFEGRAILEAVLGTDNLDDVGPENVRHITKIVMHQEFEEASRTGHDIALVKIDRPWPGPYLRLSDSPLTDPATPPGAATMIAGFGDKEWLSGSKKFARRDGGAFAAGSPVMREVDLPTVSMRKCQARYAGAAIGQGQLCAGYEEGKKDSCQGDSGGPLVTFDRQGCPYQIGIVSWGAKCAARKSYGVYTRVSHFMDWIKSNIDEPLPAIDANQIYKSTDVARQLPLAKNTVTALQNLFKGARGKLDVSLHRKDGSATSGGGVVQLKLGDSYIVRLNSNLGGRVILLDMDARGTMTQIFPNKYVRSGEIARINAGAPIAIPGQSYGFDWFEAVEPIGRGRLVALLVPDDFPLKSHVASADRLSEELGPLDNPGNYVLNLLDQLHGHMATTASDQLTPDRITAGAARGAWAINVLDYEIKLR